MGTVSIPYWRDVQTRTITIKQARPYLFLLIILTAFLTLYLQHGSSDPFSPAFRFTPIELKDQLEPDMQKPRFKHPIMILQYNCHCQAIELQRLAQSSVEQHAKYASAHGYVHRSSSGQFLPRTGWHGSPFMNKIHLLLRVALEEIEREDGVQWIMWA